MLGKSSSISILSEVEKRLTLFNVVLIISIRKAEDSHHPGPLGFDFHLHILTSLCKLIYAR